MGGGGVYMSWGTLGGDIHSDSLLQKRLICIGIATHKCA